MVHLVQGTCGFVVVAGCQEDSAVALVRVGVVQWAPGGGGVVWVEVWNEMGCSPWRGINGRVDGTEELAILAKSSIEVLILLCNKFLMGKGSHFPFG